MPNSIKKKKYSGLFYGEGGDERKFLLSLKEVSQFRFFAHDWYISIDNASGGHPRDVLERCRKRAVEASYHLVVCFVDIDLLKKEFPRNWEEEKEKLENLYGEIDIVWQVDDLEDEFRRALGISTRGKAKINSLARQGAKEFVNSDFWNRIKEIIVNKQRELEQ